jgi:CRISPR type III-B/RAMP module-associated protein Cmr5
MSSSLDQARAEFAAKRVLGNHQYAGFGTVPRDKEKVQLGSGITTTLKEYRSVVMGAVPFLQQCGLLQLAAFYASKGEAHHAVLADLAAWLKASPLTKGLCSGLRVAGPKDTFQDLAAKSASELMILEAESEAILTWLKRLVEAKAKELEAQAKWQKKDGKTAATPEAATSADEAPDADEVAKP